MITLKLNCEGDICGKGCKTCVFSETYEQTEYGEITGIVDMYCKLLLVQDGSIMTDIPSWAIDEQVEDTFRLENCPIISEESTNESV